MLVLFPFSSVDRNGDMATAAQMQTIADMGEAEVTVLAYLEAAGGDAERALTFAVEDLLRAEGDLATARRAVSHGYVRAGAMSVPADRA